MDDPMNEAWENFASKIILQPEKLHQNVKQTIKLIAEHESTHIFQSRSGFIVRMSESRQNPKKSLSKNNTITRSIEQQTEQTLRHDLNLYGAKFYKHDHKGRIVPCSAPKEFLKTVLDVKEYGDIPVLKGIVEAPILRQDGTIQSEHGYDEITGYFLFTNGLDWSDKLIKKPSFNDAKSALRRIRDNFKSLPYASDTDESVYIAFILLPFVRHFLEAAPGLVITASTSGTGKTLAMECIALLFQGERPSVYSLGDDQNELKKTVFTVLLQQKKFLFIDNIDRPVSGDFICTLFTGKTISARILGVNKVVDVNTDIIFAFNGNNVVIKGDLSNRVLHCELKANCERPEERHFDFDLRERTLKNRSQSIIDCLTLFSAWYISKQPTQKLSTFGRFEDWSRSIREMLVWLGMRDPCDHRFQYVSEDPESSDLEVIINVWHNHYGDRYIKASELVKELEEQPINPVLEDIRDIFNQRCSKGVKISPIRVGRYLKKKQRRH